MASCPESGIFSASCGKVTVTLNQHIYAHRLFNNSLLTQLGSPPVVSTESCTWFFFLTSFHPNLLEKGQVCVCVFSRCHVILKFLGETAVMGEVTHNRLDGREKGESKVVLLVPLSCMGWSRKEERGEENSQKAARLWAILEKSLSVLYLNFCASWLLYFPEMKLLQISADVTSVSHYDFIYLLVLKLRKLLSYFFHSKK